MIQRDGSAPTSSALGGVPILELQRQRQLLQMEYDEEREAFRWQSDEAGLRQKVRHGDAWWPVHVRQSFYNSLNQLCVEIIRMTHDDDDENDEHNFEYGKQVMFIAMDASVSAAVVKKGASSTLKSAAAEPKALGEGTVSLVDDDRMVVAVTEATNIDALTKAQSLSVQLAFDETSYRAMFDALERTMQAKGRLGELRDLFYSRRRVGTFTFADMGFDYLNPTQEHAVNEVLRAKDVAIVHGPPGTGKTTTLVEAIYQTLHREPQVLVCAQSNTAVDWISEKLVDRGVSVLRIGNPSRVNDKMLSFTYERRFEAHPDYPQLWAIRKAIRDARKKHHGYDPSYHQKMASLRSRAAEIEIRIRQELFGEARVIASTLISSGLHLLDGMKFGTLFIDEAAQALEPACWIAIRRAGRVVLAGDHCQLPPTVKCYEALKGGLGRTLMERLVELHPEAVTLLGIQYRMNEDIMRFSSDWFYGGHVESDVTVKYRGILDLDVPMTWIDISPDFAATAVPAASPSGPTADTISGASASVPPAPAEQTTKSLSLVNEAEARLTLLALQAYFELIGKQRILDERLDVGIISPYRGQVQLLRQLLRRNQALKPFRRFISINTVDGFQGQERDIILISLVRSNDEGQIGFLRDLRRMNVAITRARMKVIILGDRNTLTRHPFYRKLYQYIQSLRT